MRSTKRLGIAVVLALVSATSALAEEELVLDEEGAPADEEGFEADELAFGDEDSTVVPPEKMSGIDWSVGLRGSYASSSITGGKPALSLTPEASLTLGGESSLTTYSAGSELTVDGAGQARIADIHAGIEHSFELSPTTLIEGSVSGALTQADPNDSGLPANTLHAPIVGDAKAQASVAQDLGRFDAKLTLDGERLVRGPTTLDDLSTIDNSHQSYWKGGATLRLGYEVTPLIATFIEGEISAQKFDAPDPSLLAYMDGRTYELRGGISYIWGSIIAAEASIGRGWLDYFDGSITDTQDWVYNASLTYAPDETISLKGNLETTIAPSTSVAGDTDVGYTLTGEARYQVNPLLTMRGTGGYNRTLTLGTGDVAWGYDFGVGLDYRSSRHIVWSADYTYARDFVPPTPLNDTHTVSVGVKVTR